MQNLQLKDIDIRFHMSISLTLLQTWIDKTIIGLNLCPFAKASLSELTVQKSNFHNGENLANHLLTISEQLKKEKISNAIIYFEQDICFEDLFDSSIDYEEILNLSGYKIKIVVFHPDFVFEGLNFEDKANYVNRSPLPLFHLIPIELIDKAKLDNESAKNISLNNELKINELNTKDLDEHFFYMDNK